VNAGLSLQQLMDRLPQIGRVEWIGLRTQKRQPLVVQQRVQVSAKHGLHGDHYSGRSGKRQITLIQAEHIRAVASMLHCESIDPKLLRRNIVVSGINLLALKNRRFQLGGAVVEMTGLCHPCSRMEQNLGKGGYNAMRGHGGINARVVTAGEIAVGDAVKLLPEQD